MMSTPSGNGAGRAVALLCALVADQRVMVDRSSVVEDQSHRRTGSHGHLLRRKRDVAHVDVNGLRTPLRVAVGRAARARDQDGDEYEQGETASHLHFAGWCACRSGFDSN